MHSPIRDTPKLCCTWLYRVSPGYVTRSSENYQVAGGHCAVLAAPPVPGIQRRRAGSRPAMLRAVTAIGLFGLCRGQLSPGPRAFGAWTV
jgi:hypothetical protein